MVISNQTEIKVREKPDDSPNWPAIVLEINTTESAGDNILQMKGMLELSGDVTNEIYSIMRKRSVYADALSILEKYLDNCEEENDDYEENRKLNTLKNALFYSNKIYDSEYKDPSVLIPNRICESICQETASLWVDHGRYDCNMTYWENIKALILLTLEQLYDFHEPLELPS